MGTLTIVMWISIAACALLGVPFILIWWREMDKWADDEHKRFKSSTNEPQERIVVSSTSKPKSPPPQNTTNQSQNTP